VNVSGTSWMEVRAGSTPQLENGITAPSSNKAPNERLRITSPGVSAWLTYSFAVSSTTVGDLLPDYCNQLTGARSICACIA
jgi:hypothetical protein